MKPMHESKLFELQQLYVKQNYQFKQFHMIRCNSILNMRLIEMFASELKFINSNASILNELIEILKSNYSSTFIKYHRVDNNKCIYIICIDFLWDLNIPLGIFIQNVSSF